ncbi:MAG: hypothetical protein AB7G08_28250 [Hyphomicrobiaceae bacterium]
MHQDIDTWLTAIKRKDNLDRMEVAAARAFYSTLTPYQRKTFDKLLDGFVGLTALRLSRRSTKK